MTNDLGFRWIDHPAGDYKLGDFRNTGHQDMVMIGQNTAYSPSAEYILFARGNGNGSFTVGKPIATSGATGILTVGDFNRDGKLDFAAVSGSRGSRKVTVFLGNGDGTFRGMTPLPFGSGPVGEPERAFTADLNRDGKLDLLVFTTTNGYSTTESAVWEFLGNGNGTFQAPRQVENRFQPMTLADVNGDGHPDIVRYDIFFPDGTTQTWGPARFTTYLNQPGGSFLESSTYAPYPFQVMANGQPTTHPTNLWPYNQFGDPAALSLVADLDGSGKPDELAFQESGGEHYLQILKGKGDGTFTPNYDIFPFYVEQYPAYAHDLNKDGKAELVQVLQASSSLQVFKTARAPALQLELVDEIVKGGASCGWVFPNIPSASDRTAALSSDSPGVVLPASVGIPARALAAKFCYTLSPARDQFRVFNVKAELDGDMAVAWASQAYVEGFILSLASLALKPLYEGQSSPAISLTLTAAAGYSSKVRLSCLTEHSMDTCTFGANSLTVAPGAPVRTTVKLNVGAASYSQGLFDVFTIVADDGNVIHRQSVKVDLGHLLVMFPSPVISASPGKGESVVSVWNYAIPPFTPSCSGLPKGVTCSFTQQVLPYPSSNDIHMFVTVPSGLPMGSYQFKITVVSGNQSRSAASTLLITTAAPAPAASPKGGSYATAQKVYLTDTNAWATILYTLDGTEPTIFSKQYTGNTPIPIPKTTTLKAIAWVNNMGLSPVMTATYTIHASAAKSDSEPDPGP